MIFNLPLLAMSAFGYMLLLFFIAYATDQGWISRRLVVHPLTFSLSLGVYATTWTYYGSVGFAQEQGYNFLTIYLGVTLAFGLTPILLMPILRLTREYQLTSLADLFAFRYRSQLAGILVTVFMLIGSLPYIALQIRAVTESIYIFTKEASPDLLAFGFCVFITIFAILFGARHVTSKEKHEGLVVAIAFESAVKLLALLSVGITALFGVWGGFHGLSDWLQNHPQALEALYRPVQEGPWMTLLLLSFAAAFLLPRQFHMIFTENLNPRALSMAAWAFPLILLLLNLPIPLVLWAGNTLQLDMSADYYVLGVILAEAGRSPLPILAFIGGISAASGMMIVTTLALASMCLNHLLLPASYPDPSVDIYRWALWGKRMIIALILMIGYAFYELLEHNQGLVQLGLISFVAAAQFLPGVVGVLLWRRATRIGFIAGLLGGITVWSITLLFPLLESSQILESVFIIFQADPGQNNWTHATFWSLTLNSVLFVSGSLLSRQRSEESEAAKACCSETLSPPAGIVTLHSSEQFKDKLARVIGRDTAEKEVSRALDDLGMSQNSTRPAELRRLREQLERNLSGLIGPQLAHMIVNQRLELMGGARTVLADTMRYVEGRVEETRTRLRGLAAELDALHRYHRQILLDLPLGVCAVGPEREVIIWNLAMETLSGLRASDAVGYLIEDLPEPWGYLLSSFVKTDDNHVHRMRVQVENHSRWFNLHKANIIEPVKAPLMNGEATPGIAMLIEDLTDLENLEAELVHSERLASVGRLAAGVAHEIGNPVTGIACLAQNLREESDPRQINDSIEQILDQTKRITNIVQSLMTFSHGGFDIQELAPFNLQVMIEEAVRLVSLSERGKQMRWHQHCAAGLMLMGDRPRLMQVLVNLLKNACDASDSGTRIEVDVSTTDESVTIAVRDYGKGIPAHELDHIFEPFFTTKRPGEGTGLGLPLAYKIVQDHGGTIDVESQLGRGTRVSVWLPRDELQRTERIAL